MNIAEKKRTFDLEGRLIDFACLVIETVKSLPSDRFTYYLGQQLIRPGTSPALNYGEALGAESRKDFIHKMRICLKELRETNICIKILCRSNYLSEGRPIVRECHELISIFVKSIQTAEGHL